MNVFRKLKSYVQLREAVKRADAAHAKTGQRYYVMPSMSGKLLVLDRDGFRVLKKKKYISRHAKMRDVLNECFYFTPYWDGKGKLSPEGREIKEKLFYSWVDAFHKVKKDQSKMLVRRKK